MPGQQHHVRDPGPRNGQVMGIGADHVLREVRFSGVGGEGGGVSVRGAGCGQNGRLDTSEPPKTPAHLTQTRNRDQLREEGRLRHAGCAD